MAWSMLVVALGASFLSSACACSSFELNTSHGFKVLGHTMEYGKLMNSPNWVLFTTPTKSEVFLNNVSTVKAKFGVLGIGIQPNYADGMNEEGLTINLQSLYRSEYQKCDVSSRKYTTIFTQNLATWILTSFSTVDQVKKALTGKRYCVMNNNTDTNSNTHWAISDKDGGSIVLEYERGEPRVHNNYVGLMTNDPFYPWHVDNLNTYRWILPDEGDNKELLLPTGELLAGQGQVPWDQGHGFNTGGLPADASPPSRFVRMFFTRQISQVNSRPDTLDDWMKLAQGILNDIFITKGFTSPNPNGPVILESDHTSWATIRVPKTGFYAYRTYGNMQWQKVDTTKLDWTRQKTLPTSNNFQASLKDITYSLPTIIDSTGQNFLSVKRHHDQLEDAVSSELNAGALDVLPAKPAV